MTPSVCRIVHYVSYGTVSYGTPGSAYEERGQACRAAIITEVNESATNGIGLAVLSPEGMFFNRDVHYHEGVPLKSGETRRDLCGSRDYAGGTWHWPARDPGAGL